MPLTMLVLLGVGAAKAQTPIIHHDLPADEALARTVERTGLPPSQLSTVAWAGMLEAPPAVVGPGALRPCARTPTDPEVVRADVARAEATLAQGDTMGAANAFDRLVTSIGCLSRVVDGSVAARVFVHRGAARAAEGDLTAARAEFLTALALHPSGPWIDGLDDAGRPLYQEMATNLGSKATLRLLPPSTPGGPWIDGEEVAGTAEVAPGLHLFQFTGARGIESAWFTVGGDATVVVPGAFRADVLADVGSQAGNATFGGLVAAALPHAQAAYVLDEDGLWMFAREGRDLLVTELLPRREPEPEPLTRKEQRRQRREAKRAARAARTDEP